MAVSRKVLFLSSIPGTADRLGGSGWVIERPRSLGALFTELGSLPPDGFVVVSLDQDEVDASVLERMVEGLGGRHRLLLCAAGISLENAVLARTLGTGLLLFEPLDLEELRSEIERRTLPDDRLAAPAAAATTGVEVGLVGGGPTISEIIRTIIEVADTPATVLITGESGTGKELVARAVHWAGRRREDPFVTINCAAVPENLLESEFFGYEKGAFTGAVARKTGRFERASGGTLFLDEVGDMSVVLQAKLLRALEEGVIERVGGEGPVPIDVRIVAATNQNLEGRVTEGAFREDLFHRLAVVRIRIPPLRERMEDLEPLCIHFVQHFRERYDREVEGLGGDALRLLRGYDWPGNVRELRNTLDRAVLSCRGPWIRAADIHLGGGMLPSSGTAGAVRGGYPPTTPLEEVERDHIRRTLDFVGGAMGEAAELLGVHRNTLTRKVERYGLRDPDAP